MKPRLIKSRDGWWCYSWRPMQAIGYGTTPAIAYQAYVADLQFKAEMGL